MNAAYKYRVISSADGQYRFTANINSREEFEHWLNILETKTKAQFNIVHTGRCDGQRLDFYRELKCHLNVRRGKLWVLNYRKRGGKHTACPSKLSVKILSYPGPVWKTKPGKAVRADERCRMTLHWNHNHPLASADILRRHSVRPGTNEKLVNLYRHGHSIASAMECIQLELENGLKEGEKLENVLNDRSVYPDYQHCHYIYRRFFKRKHPTSDVPMGQESMDLLDQQNGGAPKAKRRKRTKSLFNRDDRLVEVIASLNEQLGEACIVHETLEGKHMVAICTPLMKRVHEHMQESGELMFVDSFGDLDRKGYRVFLLMTHSMAGGRSWMG